LRLLLVAPDRLPPPKPFGLMTIDKTIPQISFVV
jgi:hypothetical protein